jgi:hypothetical protein
LALAALAKDRQSDTVFEFTQCANPVATILAEYQALISLSAVKREAVTATFSAAQLNAHSIPRQSAASFVAEQSTAVESSTRQRNAAHVGGARCCYEHVLWAGALPIKPYSFAEGCSKATC